MATTVTLVSGATTVTLPAPPGGYPIREVKRQALARSCGGTLYVYDKGVDTYEAEITLDMLSETDKSNLQSFFHTTADGSVNTWTYTNSGGDAYTARFLNGELDFTREMYNLYSVRIHLELSAMHR